MPHDVLEFMRALREEMRQRLMQVPEYRALMALDRSIDELCAILQDGVSAPIAAAPKPAPAPAPMAEAPAPRSAGIAAAFAETLAAKLDQRNPARAASPYPPSHRAV